MPYIAVRDPFADAKDTLSSWDKCMAKTYCKWPVIVGIVLGGLIILSVVLCIARCLCCAGECAMCCCKCCTCCCPSGDRSGHKRMQSEPPPATYPSAYQAPYPPPQIDTRPPNQQYRSHAAPTFNPAPLPERAQFATFDASSKPVNEDALPAMPSWSEAKETRVEEEVIPEKQGDMEMDRLNHNGSVTNTSMAGGAAMAAGRRTPGRSPIERSATQDSYGAPQGYHNGSSASGGPMTAGRRTPGRSPIEHSGSQNSYGPPQAYHNESLASGVPHHSPHTSPVPYGTQYGYGQHQDDYRNVSPVQEVSPVYGAGAGYAQNQHYGRESPGQGYDQQYGPPGPRLSPQPAQSDNYGYAAPVPHFAAPHNDYEPSPIEPSHTGNNYGLPAPVRSPSPQYAPSGSTRYEQPVQAYPGQQTYDPNASAYPGQPTYQAFQPTQGPQSSGVARKAVNGSWKEV